MADLVDTPVPFISSLFIRTGLFVAHADDTDYGEESEDKEKSYMLRAFARIEKLSKSEIVQKCAAAAMASAPMTIVNYGVENEDDLANEIQKAALLLKDHPDPQALDQYQKAMMFIGKSVARAYREEKDHHEDEFMLESFLGKISHALNKDADAEEFKDANISPAEDSALTLISEALKPKKEKL